jgi:hypothetical protein
MGSQVKVKGSNVKVNTQVWPFSPLALAVPIRLSSNRAGILQPSRGINIIINLTHTLLIYYEYIAGEQIKPILHCEQNLQNIFSTKNIPSCKYC